MSEIINGTSEELILETVWQGQRCRLEYTRGYLQKESIEQDVAAATGTRIYLKPDSSIWSDPTIKVDLLAVGLAELQERYPQTEITLQEES